MSDRLHRERPRRAPFRGLVDIHIRRLALAHAFNQAQDQQVIHPAMPTRGERVLAVFFPERVFPFGLVRGRIQPFLLGRGSLIQVQAGRVVAECAFRPADQEDAVIGTRSDHVVLQRDGAAQLRAQQADIHISANENLFAAGIAGRKVLIAEFRKPGFTTAHRNEIIEGVAFANLETSSPPVPARG